jgi:hypothetical protein
MIKTLMGGGAAAFALIALGACSGSLQGPPSFTQTYGAVDEPCTPSKVAASQCTAHVYLVNHGGQGVGLATIVVPLKDQSQAATAARLNQNARCGGYIPETSGGAEVDLACSFELPAGKVVSAPPVLLAVNFAAASGSSSSGDGVAGVISLGLAVVAALIAAAALVMALMGRAGATMSPGATAPANRARRQRDEEEDDGRW